MRARFLGKDPESNVGDSPSQLVVMRFDDDDRFIGGELVEDPAEIVRANYWRDAAWHKAVRRDDFASESA